MHHGTPGVAMLPEPVAEAAARHGLRFVTHSRGDLLSVVDQKALREGLAEYLAESCCAALSRGYDGWRDDDLAFIGDWGIDLAGIRVPVSIWQGDQDRMVPGDHGRWLGERVAGATTHLVPGEGHLSLMKNIDAIITELARA
jgi:pimeloyl-ACP methyl ester carboxylesterase